MKNKVKLILGLLVFSLSLSFVGIKKADVKDSNVWLGIGYVCSKYGEVSPEASLAIGTIGLADSMVWGAAVGSVLPGVGSLIGGGVAGL
jgi:hypothetical protein